jgi:chromosome segregation ATPase
MEEMKMELKTVEDERTEALEKIQELNDTLERTVAQKEELEDEVQQLKEAIESISGALADSDGQTTGGRFELSEE